MTEVNQREAARSGMNWDGIRGDGLDMGIWARGGGTRRVRSGMWTCVGWMDRARGGIDAWMGFGIPQGESQEVVSRCIDTGRRSGTRYIQVQDAVGHACEQIGSVPSRRTICWPFAQFTYSRQGHGALPHHEVQCARRVGYSVEFWIEA